MHLVLHPRACPYQPRPASDTPPQSGRRLVGHPHRFEHPGREELGEHRRVETVRLHTRAREIARVSAALHTNTRPTEPSPNSRAIIIAPQLASNTTWSLPFRLPANSRIASGVLAIRPTRETRPPSATATSQKSR